MWEIVSTEGNSASQVPGIEFRLNKTTIGPKLYIIHINIVPLYIVHRKGIKIMHNMTVITNDDRF